MKVLKRNFFTLIGSVLLYKMDEKGSPQTIATPPEVVVQAQAWLLHCFGLHLQHGATMSCCYYQQLDVV